MRATASLHQILGELVVARKESQLIFSSVPSSPVDDRCLHGNHKEPSCVVGGASRFSPPSRQIAGQYAGIP